MSRRKLTSDAKATGGRTRREDACGHGIPGMTNQQDEIQRSLRTLPGPSKNTRQDLDGYFFRPRKNSLRKKVLSHKSGARQLAAAGEMCYNGENEEMEEQRWRTT